MISKYPERIGYLHLKQVNPQIVEYVLDRDLSFPEAVRMGVMTEPPLGLPDMPPLLEAVAGLVLRLARPAPSPPAGADRLRPGA